MLHDSIHYKQTLLTLTINIAGAPVVDSKRVSYHTRLIVIAFCDRAPPIDHRQRPISTNDGRPTTYECISYGQPWAVYRQSPPSQIPALHLPQHYTIRNNKLHFHLYCGVSMKSVMYNFIIIWTLSLYCLF